jgi:hypothetical protein
LETSGKGMPLQSQACLYKIFSSSSSAWLWANQAYSPGNKPILTNRRPFLANNVNSRSCHKWDKCKKREELTISVLQRLLLLGWLGNHFDPLWVEQTDVCSTAVEHLYGQHEMFPLVWVWDEQRLCCAVVLKIINKRSFIRNNSFKRSNTYITIK